MADWGYSLNDPTTVKAFSHRLYVQGIRQTTVLKLASISSSTESPDNVVQLFDDLQKGPGATVVYDLVKKVSNAGVLGDAEIAGHEVVPLTYQQSLRINQVRNPIKVVGACSQQFVPFNMRKTAKRLLADWAAERWDVSMANQLTGNTYFNVPADGVLYTGCNPVSAPTGFTDADQTAQGHMVIANGKTNENLLVAGDRFTTQMIRECVSNATTLSTPIKPLRLKGMEIFGVALLHPFQILSLISNFSTGEWGDIQLAAMKGGQITGNPVFIGSIGMIDRVVIHSSIAMPYGSLAQQYDSTGEPRFNPLGTGGTTGTSLVTNGSGAGTNIARGVFVGAQALGMAFGRAFGMDMKLKWTEELLDANNQLRVTIANIFGCIKTQFNGQDYATITLSSYETGR